MKSIKLFIILLSISFASAQEKPYDTWSLEPYVGITKVRDVTPVVPVSYGLAVRKNFNTKFGVRLTGNYTELYTDFTFDQPNLRITDPFYSGSLEGVVNMGRIMEFEDFLPWYTILVGVGGTYTYSEGRINEQILHRYSNFHLSGTIDNEIRLSNSLALKASLNVVTGVNDRPFVPESTETTSIINFNLGAVLSLGNKKQHADWYVEAQKVDTVLLQPTIIDNTKTITQREIYTVSQPRGHEYVFFDHDSYIVNRSGLNAITKSSDKLNGKNTITVIGYASPPGTSDYNVVLSKKRAMAVVDKLLSLGVQQKQVKLLFKGEADTKDGKNVDLSRRVELIVKQ